jgi:hypothetical protein
MSAAAPPLPVGSRANRARPALVALLLGLGAALHGATLARADVFGPISLVSAGTIGAGQPQQAEYAHDPAISGNGRFVVFDGSVGGVGGVWRRDLATGAVQAVAGGDAQLPSVSEDGRFVSFTTNEGARLAQITQGLGGEPAAAAPGVQEPDNVYVRDMSGGPQDAGAFVVASAPDGSNEPLTYAEAGTRLGAVATGRTAISADGAEVVFVTTAVSDLAQPRTPAEPSTPPLQVAVRYLRNSVTKLVSVDRQTGGAVSALEGSQVFGALYPGNSRTLEPRVPAYAAYGASPPPGASISADGSTVAWMGEDVGDQAAMLAGEQRRPTYTEPLWRRIAPGSETPVERVTGGSDPANPACAASGESALPSPAVPGDPCQGPFDLSSEGGSSTGVWNAAAGQMGDFVPRLSADGYTVAFMSKGLPIALGENFGERSAGEPADLYVADMRPGLTRLQALRPLTELAGAESAGEESVAPIFDFGISPDGGQVAFATRRTQFPLGSPAFVSPASGESGMNELFDVDLRNDTLTRVSGGFEGGVSEHPHATRPAGEDPYGEPGDGALSPSFSADGRLLSFASTASNLAFGDGNTPPAGPLDGSDAFLVERKLFGVLPTQQYISAPPQAVVQPQWRLGVSARSRRDGTVLLYVDVPGDGALRAAARGAVLAKKAPGGKLSHASGARGRGPTKTRRTVVRRTVASAARATRAGAGIVTLVLKLARPYTALASARGGFSASVEVLLSAPGQRTLRQSISVNFLRAVHRARRTRAVHGSNRRGAAGR